MDRVTLSFSALRAQQLYVFLFSDYLIIQSTPINCKFRTGWSRDVAERQTCTTRWTSLAFGFGCGDIFLLAAKISLFRVGNMNITSIRKKCLIFLIRLAVGSQQASDNTIKTTEASGKRERRIPLVSFYRYHTTLSRHSFTSFLVFPPESQSRCRRKKSKRS